MNNSILRLPIVFPISVKRPCAVALLDCISRNLPVPRCFTAGHNRSFIEESPSELSRGGVSLSPTYTSPAEYPRGACKADPVETRVKIHVDVLDEIAIIEKFSKTSKMKLERAEWCRRWVLAVHAGLPVSRFQQFRPFVMRLVVRRGSLAENDPVGWERK